MPHTDASHQTAEQVASLVQSRVGSGFSLEEIAADSGVSQDALERVERHGSAASLSDIAKYATAVGYQMVVSIHAEEQHARRLYKTCDACGGKPRHHAQRHLEIIDVCADVEVADLWWALRGVNITVVDASQGWSDKRSGGEAYLSFPTLADARAFYALADRASGDVPWRAGLRGVYSKGGSWTSSVRWDMLPGDLLADASVVVRFPADDLKALVRLASNPPRSALADLVVRRSAEYGS
jgi:transcriptional regulator with XRE-family HTH domain